MNNTTQRAIFGEGGKGGGGSRTPTEAANTLQSRAIARVIDLVSEGLVIGLWTGEGSDGKKFPFKAVFFDGVPIQGSDGDYIDAGLSEPALSAIENLTSINFEGVKLQERVGLPDQTPIDGFSEVESEITINQQVTDASPVLFQIVDDDIDSIRLKLRLPALYEQTGAGDLIGASLNYIVEVQPSGGSFSEIVNDTVNGKNTSPYERQSKISLASLGAFPLTFRVSRVTPDSDKASKQTDLFVNSYTEIQEANLKYSNSAIIGIEVNSELFSGRVPKRSYAIRGIAIQVPSNYFPGTKFYNRDTNGNPVVDGGGLPIDQIWDGTFYLAWSDNPAWVLYDVLSNSRYGLGEFITASQIDKFALYSIAQYCDELVDSGLGDGTQESRFVFNGVISTRREAYEVINAITSTFRGMNFWSAGGVTAVADSPKNATRLITKANIVGRFEYSGTAKRARHSAALVTWNNPDLDFEQDVEIHEESRLRELYGWREIEIVGFGTTSRGQARRQAKWILDSEENETETLKFVGILDVSDIRPGEIIQVADEDKQGLRRGGRIISYTAGSPGNIQVDSSLTIYSGDTILAINVNGGIESLAVQPQTSGTTIILIDTPSATLQVNTIFIHRGTSLEPTTWRVLSVREDDRTKFEIVCMTYDGSKYARIESGIVLENDPVISNLPTGNVLPATNLTLFESLYKAGTSVNNRLDISWTRPADPRVNFYRVEVKRPNQEQWEILEITPHIHSVIENAEDGLWSFRVTAGKNDQIAAGGLSSVLEVIDYTIIGKTVPPPDVLNLTAVRGFDGVVLDWDDVVDLDLVGYEVRRGSSWGSATVEILASALYASTFTATVSTTSAQDYFVRAIDTLGNPSVAIATVTTSIQALPAVTNLYGYQVDDKVRLVWDSLSLIENIQYEIKSGISGSDWDSSNLLGRVADSEFQGPHPVNSSTVFTFRVKPFVSLQGGNVSYGLETTIDVELFPLSNGLTLQSRTEETAWTSIELATPDAFLLHGRVPDFTMTEGSSADVNYDYAATPEISNVSAPTFHCNLTVNSVGTPEGLIFGAGRVDHYGMMACFDGSGNLIIRAGVTDPILPQLADTTSMVHQWNMFEVSGNRVDDFGSNDLAVTGSVTSKTLTGSATMGACASFVAGAYLSGLTHLLAGKDWTLSFRYVLDPDQDYSGQVFGIGGVGGFTISVRFFESTQTMDVEIFTTSGQEILSVSALDGSLAATTRIVIWYVDSTKTVSVEMRNSDRDDIDGLVQASKVLSNGIADQTGSIYIANGPHYVAETFFGQLGHFVLLDRAVTSNERWDLHHYVAPTASPRLLIPYASVPKDSAIDLVWKLNKGDVDTPSSIDAWLDGVLFSETDDVGHMMPATAAFPAYEFAGINQANQWIRTGVDNANYDKTWLSIFEGETGSFDTALNSVVTLNSDLKYWRDEPVIDPLEIISDSLTLTSGAVYAVYDFPFSLPNENIGRLWAEIVSSSISANALDIVDATMQIFDATFKISQSSADIPQVVLMIDIDNTGTFIPFEAGTYRFTNATVRAILQRGAGELTRPSIDNLSVFFVKQNENLVLQATTTDATPTTLTFDGGAVTAANIITIPDDFLGRIDGNLIARKSDNSQFAEYRFTCILKRQIGVASTTIESFTISEREDDSVWDLTLSANTTFGGLNVVFTGKAATGVSLLCDIDVREIG